MNFEEIFSRHFFSNHHIEAQTLELELCTFFKNCECVTFSSFCGLLASINDEVCGTEDNILIDCDNFEIQNINLFLHATNRKGVLEWSSKNDDIASLKIKFAIKNKNISIYIKGIITNNFEKKGFILDFSGTSELINSTAAFVTPDPLLAEKIRWSRSSYGRQSKSNVTISANGRVSEFQAKIVANKISS
ncbi:hypothetical protein [Vreelandella titanicae]|uniref:hypothetical protein n=1 Tax=Vreelandella titanicae TaxID=664683 RepID=UPI0039BFD06A